MVWWHVTIASSRRESRFLDPAVQLAAVRMLARICGPALVLFCVVDEHLHLVLYGTREQVGRLAGAVAQGLTKGLGVRRVEPARFVEVDGRKHVENLVPYVLTQTEHHKIPVHPAAWRGSCLADLVGARRVPGFDPHALARALPRWDIEERVLSAAGLGNAPLEPVLDDRLLQVGAAAIWEAAGLAIGTLAPISNEPTDAACRVAYAHLAKAVPGARVAAGLTESCWSRLTRREPDPLLIDAIRRRLALDQRVWDVTRARPELRALPSGMQPGLA